MNTNSHPFTFSKNIEKSNFTCLSSPDPLPPLDPTHRPHSSLWPPTRVLCTILVTNPWTWPSSLFKFHLFDKKSMCSQNRWISQLLMSQQWTWKKNTNALVWWSSCGFLWIKPFEYISPERFESTYISPNLWTIVILDQSASIIMVCMCKPIRIQSNDTIVCTTWIGIPTPP